MNSLRNKSCQYRFTLVELLIVVAIIAILIAILLPALKMVKEKGKETDCRGKLRQFGILCTMYANDNDGWIRTYSSSNPWWTIIPGMPEGENLDVRAQKICCPSGKQPTTRHHVYGVLLDTNETKVNADWYTRLLYVKEPSTYDFMADTAAASGNQAPYYYSVQTGDVWHRVCIRHGRGANLAFVDGHVVLLDCARLKENRCFYVRLNDGTQIAL